MFNPAEIDAAVFPEVGDLAVFSPGTGPDIEDIFIMVDGVVEESGFTRLAAGGALITAQRSDVGRPVKDDRFITVGQTWVVERPFDIDDPSTITLACKKG